jgi:putative membrane protein
MWNGAWWMFAGPMTMILFFGAIIALIVLLVRWLDGSKRNTGAPPSGKAPLDILKERFARGKIDKEEYEERRKLLQD